MNATLSFRGRRLLPLLVISCGFAGFPASAQADMLTSRLTDKSIPSQTEAFTGGVSAHVVYRSRREDGATEEDSERGERGRVSVLPALAVIVVFPPFQPPPPLPPPPPPPPPPPVIQPPPVVVPQPPPDGGTGHTSGGPTPPSGTPEPASLILALTGSGTAAFLALVRRRRRRSAMASAC